MTEEIREIAGGSEVDGSVRESFIQDRFVGANYMDENGDFCDPVGHVIFERCHPFNPGSLEVSYRE